MQTDFNLYKVDMKYIRNLHNLNIRWKYYPDVKNTGI